MKTMKEIIGEGKRRAADKREIIKQESVAYKSYVDSLPHKKRFVHHV